MQRFLLRILFLSSPATAFLYAHRGERIRSALNSVEDARVMVNGMPGPMATAAAEACLRKGLNLAPIAMTGPDIEACTIHVHDTVTDRSAKVKLIPSTEKDELEASIAGVQEATDTLVAIDYTHPSAVNRNAQFYVAQGIPFVMGTTGGDRDKLSETVEKHNCVIAPNMGKQIVAMQAALEYLEEKYPSAFSGYTLRVKESHQLTKADTSGTAKAVVDSLKTLNAQDDFEYDDIEMIRNDEEAIKFGVPEDALKGHAFHRYTLTSSDGSVEFALEHNVAGRTVYAEGTADACKFLIQQIDKQDSDPKVYTMVDVLAAGALD